MMYTHLFKSLPASTAAFATVLASAAASQRRDANGNSTAKCHHKTKDVVGMLHDMDERVSCIAMIDHSFFVDH
jgi:hypothetical protein